MDGIINLNKPPGITSHAAVIKIRKLAGKDVKVGHTGTLDPVASGVLVLCLGKATKLSPFFTDYSKEYLATLKLGITTTTDDAEGQILTIKDTSHLPKPEITAAFLHFLGTSQQRTPQYAARRYKGERLYTLARRGEKVELPVKPVTITELRILGWALPYITFLVRCSKGTYIRSLCRDIGELLGVGGHLSFLVRTRVGSYNLSDAQLLSSLTNKETLLNNLLPLENCLKEIPALTLGKDAIISLVFGRSLKISDLEELNKLVDLSRYYRIFDVADNFWAIGKTERDKTGTIVLRPERVLRDARYPNLDDRFTNGFSVGGD